MFNLVYGIALYFYSLFVGSSKYTTNTAQLEKIYSDTDTLRHLTRYNIETDRRLILTAKQRKETNKWKWKFINIYNIIFKIARYFFFFVRISLLSISSILNNLLIEVFKRPSTSTPHRSVAVVLLIHFTGHSTNLPIQISLVLVPKSPREVETTGEHRGQLPTDQFTKPVLPVSTCFPQRDPVWEYEGSVSCTYAVSKITPLPKPRGILAEKSAAIHAWACALSLLSNQVKPVSSCRC